MLYDCVVVVVRVPLQGQEWRAITPQPPLAMQQAVQQHKAQPSCWVKRITACQTVADLGAETAQKCTSTPAQQLRCCNTGPRAAYQQ